MTEKNDKNGEALYAMSMIILLLLGAWFVYYYAIQPILVRSIDYSEDAPIHRDITLYTEEEYRTYEDGEAFYQILQTVPSISNQEPVSFSHHDTKPADNPIHGKHADYFSVDFQFEQESYLYEKQRFVTSGCYDTESVWGEFSHYLTVIECGIYSISFSDSNYLIRITLITEIDEFDSFYNQALSSMDIEW